MIDTPSARETDRLRLEQQISAYLASGGQIHPLPGNTRMTPWPARCATIDPATRLKRRRSTLHALKWLIRKQLAPESPQ